MPTPIGALTLVAEDGAITGCYMELPDRELDDVALGERDDAGLIEAVRQLQQYFARERTEFTLPLAPRGDAF